MEPKRRKATLPRGMVPTGALALLAIGLVGCSATHTHTGLGTSAAAPEGAAPLVIRHEVPDPYRAIAISVRTHEETAGAPSEIDPESSLPFQTEMLEERLAELLRESGAFSRVIRVRGKGPKEIGDAARKHGAGLLVQLDLDRAYLTHLGGTPGATWCLFIWIFGGWATHWWHDQIYEMDFQPRVLLTDLVSGREVCAEGLPAVCREEALCFHERSRGVGTYLLTLIWPPGLAPDNAETVMESMLAAAGPEVWLPLGDLLSRLYLPEVVRIRTPEGEDLPVAFGFKSPVEGALAEKKTGLDLELELKKTLTDLVTVKVGKEVLWDARDKENIPRVDRITFSRDDLPFEKGKATIEVSLRSVKEPIRVEVLRVPEVRLRKAPGAS